MTDRAYVASLFDHLRHDKAKFFEKVSDDVQWTVMGSHSLAGDYFGKENFLDHTFRRLEKLLKEGMVLAIRNIMVDGDLAAVELEALSTAKNGKPFNNRYCWIVKFDGGIIKEVRAYLDSALVQRLIDENETPA